MDIIFFNLNTPLDIFEYLCMHINQIPAEIIKELKLREIREDNGYVYIQVKEGMYGLAQVGILANKLLNKSLSEHGYYQSTITPGLWRHCWCPISFALVVDNFGIKYINKADADHLIATLEQHYELYLNWKGALFCGISLDWDYNAHTVCLSMPGYVDQALHQFENVANTKTQ